MEMTSINELVDGPCNKKKFFNLLNIIIILFWMAREIKSKLPDASLIVVRPVNEDKVDAEFICPICQCVLNEPLQTSCYYLFCKTCLMETLEIRPNCPTCCEILTSNLVHLRCNPSLFKVNTLF